MIPESWKLSVPKSEEYVMGLVVFLKISSLFLNLFLPYAILFYLCQQLAFI